MKRRRFGCFTTILLVVSFLSSFGTIFLSYRSITDWRDARRATGVVIENAEEVNDEGGEVFRPKILFMNAQNDSVIFSARFQSSFFLFDVGDHVNVLYLPEKAITDTFTERWAGITLLGMMGFGGLMISFFIIRFASRDGQRIDQLRKNGNKIIARINVIEANPGSEDTSPSIVIFCEARIGGLTQKFISDRINKETTSLQIGDELTVFYEHRNPENYYVVIPSEH